MKCSWIYVSVLYQLKAFLFFPVLCFYLKKKKEKKEKFKMFALPFRYTLL